MVVSDYIAISSLVISLVSFIISKRISNKALNVQHATIESVIAESISNAAKNMREASITFHQTKESDPSYEVIKLNHLALIEDYLNAYDHACQRYIDDKIDRVRFKKSYEDSLMTIFNSDAYKDFIKTPANTKYQALHTVQQKFRQKESL